MVKIVYLTPSVIISLGVACSQQQEVKLETKPTNKLGIQIPNKLRRSKNVIFESRSSIAGDLGTLRLTYQRVDTQEDQNSLSSFRLDLQHRTQGRWLKRRIVFQPVFNIAGSCKTSIRLWHLDLTHRKRPLLIISILEQGMYGPVGGDVLVAFPQGWNGPVTVQSWMAGSWKGGNTTGEYNLLKRDKTKRPYLEAIVFSTGLDLDTSGTPITSFKARYVWDDKKAKFVANAATLQMLRKYSPAGLSPTP